MNFRFLIFFLLLFCRVISLSAQQKKIIYYDRDWNVTTRTGAVYYREISLDSTGKPLGLVRDHYHSGALQWIGKIYFLSPDSESYDSVATWSYENGNVQRKQVFSRGVPDGFDSAFYADGKLQFVYIYTNGLHTGESRDWNQDGRLAAEGHYNPATHRGEVKIFYDDGIVLVRHLYDDSDDGEKITYYPNGKILSEEFYVMGVPVGKHFGLTQDGDTTWIKIFSPRGQMRSSLSYDADHHLTQQVTLDTVTKMQSDVNYFADGKISSISFLKNGRREGRSLTYFANGKLSEAIQYQNDIRVSDSTWYENGQLKTAFIFSAGKVKVDVVYRADGGKYSEKIPDSLIVHIAKDNVGCLYGFKNSNDAWIVKPAFNDAGKLGNGFFYVVKNGKYGVYGIEGNAIIAPQYDNISPLKFLSPYEPEENVFYAWYYGFFIVQQNGKKGVVNLRNKIIIPVAYDMIAPSENMNNINIGVGRFSGNTPLDSNVRMGYADTSGFISPLKYRCTFNFDENGFSLFTNNDLYRGTSPAKWGVIDFSGKEIIPPVYDQVINAHTTGAYFWVTKNNKTGLCDRNGKFILDTIYHIAMNVWNDSLIGISLNGKCGYVSPEGKFLLQPVFDSVSANKDGGYYRKGKLYGLLGENFSVRTQPVYQSLQRGFYPSRQGTDIVNKSIYAAKRNSKFGAIDENDSVLIPFAYDDAWFPREGTCIAFIKGDSLCLFSLQAHPEKISVRHFFAFKTGIAVFSRENFIRSDDTKPNDLAGIVNPGGKILLQPHYAIRHAGADGILFSETNNFNAILSPDGKIHIIPQVFYNPVYNEGGYVYVTALSGKVGVLNMDGKLVADTVYHAIAPANKKNNGLWVKVTADTSTYEDDEDGEGVNLYGGWIFLDENGKKISKAEWFTPADFHDSLAIVQNNDKYGLLRRDGKLILDTVYDNIRRDRNGFFLLQQHGKKGFADKRGKIIVQAQWGNESGFFNDKMLVYSSGKNGIVDTSGKMLAPLSPGGIRNYNINLADEILFYEQNYPDEGKDYSVSYLRMGDVIPGFDSVQKIKNAKARMKVSNALIADAAFNYCDFTKYGFSYNDYYAGNYYRDFSEGNCDDYGASEDTTTSVAVQNATAFTCSVLWSESDCYSPPHGPGYCQYEDVFTTYSIRGDSIFPLTMDSLFNAKKNYRVALNAMLIDALRKIDDPDFDCSNPQDYAALAGDKFSICDTAVVFYLSRHGDENTDDGEDKYLEVPVSISVLKPIIAPKSILWKVMKK